MEFNVRYNQASGALRIIETIFELDEVNAHISNGRVVLFEPIELNERLYREGFIFKNYTNGHCRFANLVISLFSTVAGKSLLKIIGNKSCRSRSMLESAL